MQILWNYNFKRKSPNSWVFQNDNPEAIHADNQEENEKLAAGMSNILTPEFKEKIQDLIQSSAKNPEFFGENGKENFVKYIQENPHLQNTPQAQIDNLYKDLQQKRQETMNVLGEKTPPFTNRKAIEKDLWQKGFVTETDIKQFIKNLATTQVAEQDKFLTETEKEQLLKNEDNFWENKKEYFKNLITKFEKRPKTLDKKRESADKKLKAVSENFLKEENFANLSEKEITEKLEDSLVKMNLLKLAPFLAEKLLQEFEEKKQDTLLAIQKKQAEHFNSNADTILETSFANFSEKKGLLKISMTEFETTLKEENPNLTQENFDLTKFTKQKEAFAKKIETAKNRANTGADIIENAKEKALNGEWKNLSKEELTKKTNQELANKNLFKGLPKSLQKLLGERLSYLWGKAEGEIKNSENKESKDKISRKNMSAAWNKMTKKLENFEQNFSSKKELKEFFIAEYFSKNSKDAQAYLKNHPNFNNAVEAQFVHYAKEKKEANKNQQQVFEKTIGAVSNKKIQKAMQKSFAKSNSFAEKNKWITELEETYVPKYEKSLQNLTTTKNKLSAIRTNLKNSNQAKELLKDIDEKILTAENSWNSFDKNFISPVELEKNLDKKMLTLNTIETNWNKENLRIQKDISAMNLDEAIKCCSETEISEMKKNPSALAKKFDVWTDEPDVWKNNEPDFKKKLLTLHKELKNSENLSTSASNLDAQTQNLIQNMSAEKIDPTKIKTASQFAQALGEQNKIFMPEEKWQNGGKQAFSTKFNELWPQHQERIKVAEKSTETIESMDTNFLKESKTEIKTRNQFDRALGEKFAVSMSETDWQQWGADKFYAKTDELSDDFSKWQNENGEVGINDLTNLEYAHQLNFKNVILKNTDNLGQKFGRLQTILESGKGTERWLKDNEKNTLPFLLEMLDTLSDSEFSELQKDLNNKDSAEEITTILTQNTNRNIKTKKLMSTHVEEWNKFSESQTEIADKISGKEENEKNTEEEEENKEISAEIIEDLEINNEIEKNVLEIESDLESLENNELESKILEPENLENGEFEDNIELDEKLEGEEILEELDSVIEDDEIIEETEDTDKIAVEDAENSLIEEDIEIETDEEQSENNEIFEADVSKTNEDEADSNIEDETEPKIKEQTELDTEAAEEEMQDILKGFLKKINKKEVQKENHEFLQEEKESKTHFTEKHVNNGMNFGDLISKSILFYELENNQEVVRNIQLTDEQKKLSIENAAEVFDILSDKLFEYKELDFLSLKIKEQNKTRIVIDISGNKNKQKFVDELVLNVKINE